MSAPALIGYDGGDDAARAIRRAGPLLAPRPAVVACVWEAFSDLVMDVDAAPGIGLVGDTAAAFDAEAESRAAEIAQEGATLAAEAGLQASIATARGRPTAWQALLELAEEHDVAVTVLGCTGIGALKGALIGSVASGVVHRSTRPVLLVPPDRGVAAAPDAPIAIAYDGSDHAQRAIAAAGELMRGRAAVVHTVWTSLAGVAAASSIGVPAGVGKGGVESVDAELRGRAERTAAQGAALAISAGLDARAEALEADLNVAHTLLERARSGNVAALVAGSRGRSLVADVLLGSVSGRLVHHAPVPVLVVPAG